MIETTTNNIPVLVTVCVFFSFSFLCGVLSHKKASKGFLSFMIADKSLPWWAIAGSAYATYAGTITYLAWVGSSGAMGISASWQFVIHATGFMMMGIFFVPILARMKRVTLAEPLGERYDSGVRRIASGISFVSLIGNTANQILGLGVILSMFSSVNLQTACIIATVILIIYVSAGGMYGVAYADTFQGIIMLLFTIVAPIVLLLVIGGGSVGEGFSTALSAVPHQNRSMNNISGNQLATWLLIMPFTNLLRPELYGRIFAARSPKEGVKAWNVATALIVLTMLPVIVMGIICKYAIPDFAGASDQYGPAMFSAIAPGWLTIFYVVCIVAAAASTASSLMMGCSSHYITDFHLPIFYKDKKPSDRSMVNMSRLAIVFFTGIALYWAVAWQSLLSIFTFCFTVIVCGILMPYVGMFFWPRMTTAGAKAAAILGAGCALLWKFALQPWGLLPAGLIAVDPAIPSMILAVSSAIIVSLLTEPEYGKVLAFGKAYKLPRLVKWAEGGLSR